eukprot:tig00000293_g23887.t1
MNPEPRFPDAFDVPPPPPLLRPATGRAPSRAAGAASAPRTGAATGTARARDSLFIVAIVEGKSREAPPRFPPSLSADRGSRVGARAASYIYALGQLEVYNPKEARTPALEHAELPVPRPSGWRRAALLGQLASAQPSVVAELQANGKCAALRGALAGPNPGGRGLCVQAAGALLRHVEAAQDVAFEPRALKARPPSPPRRLQTRSRAEDLIPGDVLRLVAGVRTGDPRRSLFGVLNLTRTASGARMLRTSLLQPLARREAINMRLDCLDELVAKDRLFLDCQAALANFLDPDHLLSQFVYSRKKRSEAGAAASIRNLVYLKQLLEAAPVLAEALAPAEGPLLRHMRAALLAPELSALRDELGSVLQEEAAYARGALQLRRQLCFAVKRGASGLLDVARQTYLETNEGPAPSFSGFRRRLADRRRYDRRAAAGAGQHSPRRGFFLSFALAGGGEQLPQGLVQATTSFSLSSLRFSLSAAPPSPQVAKQGRRCTGTTEALASLSARARESEDEMLLLTESVVASLAAGVRGRLDPLHRVADCVALLDMICAFAAFVGTGGRRARL